MMQLHFIAVGNRMPAWVQQGYVEFARRMPPECKFNLVEIAPEKRTKGSDYKKIIAKEGERILAAMPKGAQVLALDVKGRQWSTEELAQQLDDWMLSGQDVAFLIGGPEGLADSCKRYADGLWSLSRLTLPHPLVRVLLAEQLYRAWTILKHHPYHRGT
jgi:23S rRNA (pseudouridine1915-N3)-methyltransferase